MFNITQFRRDIIIPTLAPLQIRSESMAELLVFTCAVESAGGTYVRQINGGEALGIYQIEPASYSDVWNNYILRKPDIVNLLALHFGITRIPEPSSLITDLRLATFMCAYYYQHKKCMPLDKEVETLWGLYKEFYNTSKGKAQKETSIKAYQKFIKE